MAYTVFSGDATQGSAGGDLSGAGHVDVFIPELWSAGMIMPFSYAIMIMIIAELSGNPKCKSIRQPEPKIT